MHSEWYFSWCMQLQESQEMNRDKERKRDNNPAEAYSVGRWSAYDLGRSGLVPWPTRWLRVRGDLLQ